MAKYQILKKVKMLAKKTLNEALESEPHNT